MLESLKRLLGSRAPTNEQLLDEALAGLAQGWSLQHFESLKRLAEDGLAAAQYQLALRYERALGVVQDLDDALRWHERAAEQGHPEAQAEAGLLLLAGPPGTSDHDESSRLGAVTAAGTRLHYRKDEKRAAHWNRLAAESGVADAQLRYGLQLAKGLGVEADLESAKGWLLRSAEQGNVAGMTAFGIACVGGYGGTVDRATALRWLRRAADAGQADAQYWLGVAMDPQPLTPDDESARSAAESTPSSRIQAQEPRDDESQEDRAQRATTDDTGIAWLLQAAEQGHVSAMYRLGLAYWSGRQVPLDLSLAETWLRRAVSRQSVDAMRALAQMQLEQPANDGVEAATLLWQAAEAGDSSSAALLGELYLEGRGVPRDAVEAARWLVSAGSSARPEAIAALAGIQAGDGAASSDAAPARDWLEQAAEGGDLAATFTLGSLYYRGMGLERDDRLAAACFQRAADRGSSAAAFYLGLLFADESSDQHDDRGALRWLQVASERCYLLAVCNWAAMVYQGRGQPADSAKAVRILKHGISRGNLAATAMLAEWLTDGYHLPPDPRAAHELLQSALVIGDPSAAAIAVKLHLQHQLPADTERLHDILDQCCNDPRQLARRGQRAVATVRLALAQLLEAQATGGTDAAIQARIRELYESAAHGDLPEAQAWLARQLEADDRSRHDPAVLLEARRWRLAAARRGDIESLLKLSETSHRAGATGSAADGDDLSAIRYSGWMVAALSGNALAQRELGKLYWSGEGCDADRHQAARWLDRAASQGDGEASRLLDILSSDPTASLGGDSVALEERNPGGGRHDSSEGTASWHGITGYDDIDFADHVELIGATVMTLPSPGGREWSDPWCESPNHRPYSSLRIELAPVRAWTIPDATVSAEFVVHSGQKLFLDSSLLLQQERAANREMVTERLLALLAECEGDVDVRWQHDTVLTLHHEGGDTWGHFLVQSLPRMLLFLERFPEGKVALPEDHLDYFEVPGPAQMLQLLGVARERFIPLKRRSHYRFGAVVLMDFLYDFKRQLPYPQALRLLRDTLYRTQPQLAPALVATPNLRPCFIRRTPSEVGRQIANEADLLPLLERHAIEPRELGRLPVEEQLRSWASGRCMMSTIGSDMSNLVFAPRGSTVLALTPDWFDDTFFYGLAQACGIHWFELRCGRMVDAHPVAHRSAFSVDPDALADVLDTWLVESSTATGPYRL